MKIAIPLANGKLAMHFGHCEYFALVEVDQTAKEIVRRSDIDAPPHEPGLLPPWLADKGSSIIIAGGMSGLPDNATRWSNIFILKPLDNPPVCFYITVWERACNKPLTNP